MRSAIHSSHKPSDSNGTNWRRLFGWFWIVVFNSIIALNCFAGFFAFHGKLFPQILHAPSKRYFTPASTQNDMVFALLLFSPISNFTDQSNNKIEQHYIASRQIFQ